MIITNLTKVLLKIPAMNFYWGLLQGWSLTEDGRKKDNTCNQNIIFVFETI